MTSSVQTLRERIASFAERLSPEALVLFATFAVALCTSVAIVHQTLLLAVKVTGLLSVPIALLAILIPVQGLVLPHLLARTRPRIRLTWLGVLLLAAVISHLAFLFDWWQFLHHYVELLSIVESTALQAPPTVATAIRQTFLPHILTALLKDIFLCAYLECLVWSALSQRKQADSPTRSTGTVASTRGEMELS